MWAYVDVAAFDFPISLAIGCLACTIAHDCPGRGAASLGANRHPRAPSCQSFAPAPRFRPMTRLPGPRSRARDGNAPRLQDTIRLSADGLAKVLGDLEARVLRAVWELGEPVPARAVFELVIVDHPVSPLTVITVLNKLVDKRILSRRKRQELLHYSARLTEEEFVTRTSRRVVEGILSFSPNAVAASMVDVLSERDPEHLAELARLIRRRVSEQRKSARTSGDGKSGTDETE